MRHSATRGQGPEREIGFRVTSEEWEEGYTRRNVRAWEPA